MDNTFLAINFIVFTLVVICYFFLVIAKRAPRLFLFYLCSFFLFIESHIVLALTTSFHFGYSEWFYLGEFSDNVKYEMIIFITLYLLGMLLGMLVISTQIKYVYADIVGEFNEKNIAKLVLVVIVAIIPLVANYLFGLLSFIRDNGFYALYEGTSNISGGFILDFLFLLLYTLLITSKQKFKVTVIIFTMSIIYLVMGLRLDFIFKVFPVVVYWCLVVPNLRRYVNKKTSVIVVLFLATIVFGLQYSVSIRDNLDMTDGQFYLFLKQQGVSINVIGMAIKEKNNQLLNDMLILSPIVDSLNAIVYKLLGSSENYSGNSVAFVVNSLSLSHKLSYIENPQAYLDGFGVGGASISELFLLGGGIACFIGGFITYVVIVVFELFSRKNSAVLLLVMLTFGKIVYSPRGEYLSFLSIDRMLLMCIAMLLIISLLRAASFSPLRVNIK
ncbi:MAG: O-antigen polysaccharide polymerase Wzy [Aeromonas sp.]|uniref:O-antigen polysaccharide polymerase Wzy n=1 Tax=Aeromonas caviae TaxID=648 RepID=UPI002910A853|nr:O-antigen polysaccharide polymerase Wzy [Aeromonas caviae]MDU7311109.1 O-antigen polysaccharide polymerase Wzy [Aeromonas sp.]MDX7804321.1 O-antigen polysaccharide polymerase Wzy [Aeromonas caviae]